MTLPGLELSVILVNWNGVRLLAGCLRSLASAIEGLRAETILVDNGSTDGSVGYVRKAFSSVRVIEAGRNLGFAGGNNLGLREARGRLLLLLNTDTKIPSATLDRMVVCMQRDRRTGILGCSHSDEEGRPQVSYERAFGGPLSASFRATDSVAEEGLRDAAWISGACMLVRREMYEEVGGLDEDFPLYYEDVDWCYRAHQKGWAVRWAGGVHIVHALGGSSSSMSQEKKRRVQVLSESLFYAKHAGPTKCFLWLLTGIGCAAWYFAWSLLRFAFRPRRRTYRRLRHRWNELAAFAGAGRRIVTSRRRPAGWRPGKRGGLRATPLDG